jgi:hypothetical protein
MDDEHLFIIPGMPLKDFPIAPTDQPGCKLVTCNHCNKKMWLSEKKRILIMEHPEPFVACWHCLLEMAEKGDMKCDKLIRIDI